MPDFFQFYTIQKGLNPESIGRGCRGLPTKQIKRFANRVTKVITSFFVLVSCNVGEEILNKAVREYDSIGVPVIFDIVLNVLPEVNK